MRLVSTDEIITRRRGRRGKSEQARDVLKIIALRAALKWGVENGYFQTNPLRNMKLLKETDAGSKVRYLTDDERARLFAALDEREARMRDARNNHNEWLSERESAQLVQNWTLFLRIT
jgi:hypothetical protein